MVEAGSEGSRLSHVMVRSELSVGSSISSTFRVSGMIFFNLVEAFFGGNSEIDISVLPGSILQGTLPGYPAVPFSIWFPVSVFANLISAIIKIHSREASGLPVLT